MRDLVGSRTCLLVVACFLGWPVPGGAHGDVHGQIEAVTQEIEKAPRNAELFLRRGELNRVHGDWDAAQADYAYAQALDPGLSVIDLARGRLFLQAGWPRSAKESLDRFLSRNTNHVVALTTRARALGLLGDREGAARDYTAAIAYSREPTPDLYIERARVLTTEDGASLAAALAGLDEGIRRLGPLVTLQLYAIDLEVRLGRVNEALGRLETIAAKSPRKETWFARRGEILQEAGRSIEALEAYNNSLAAIKRLPPSRAMVPAMLELRKRVEAALEELAGVSTKEE